MTKLKLKRMMSLILAMSLILTMLNRLSFQVTAVETEYSAYSILDTGACGDALTWTLYDNGTLIISGTGTMFDYNDGSAPWYLYRESIQRIVIEDEVCNIGSCAFDSCFAVTEVAIGNAVESIGSWAFASCSNLRQIDIGKNVNFIAAWAFAYSSRLGMVRLSDSLTKMEGGNICIL